MSPSAPERRLQRLEWTVVRRLDGLLQGDYRTIFKGQGLDLADIREYAFGDDVRHIDWNVTARLDAPYVREYLEDRETSRRRSISGPWTGASATFSWISLPCSLVS